MVVSAVDLIDLSKGEGGNCNSQVLILTFIQINKIDILNNY